jgi:hypothetical protein
MHDRHHRLDRPPLKAGRRLHPERISPRDAAGVAPSPRSTWDDGLVSGGFEDRIAHNEALFREVNERIEAGSTPRDVADAVGFRCECGMLRCNMLVELTLPEYEAVRSDPHFFLMVPGHEIPEVEVVIDTSHSNYVVVEKRGEAGRAAARDTHPRDD